MKKKNKSKKTYTAEARIPFPMLLANVLVFVAVFGLCYVWLCARCDSLGTEIKKLENEHQAAQVRLINEQDRWSNLLAPANFERALNRHGLKMTLPESRQIVRVSKSKFQSKNAVAMASVR